MPSVLLGLRAEQDVDHSRLDSVADHAVGYYRRSRIARRGRRHNVVAADGSDQAFSGGATDHGIRIERLDPEAADFSYAARSLVFRNPTAHRYTYSNKKTAPRHRTLSVSRRVRRYCSLALYGLASYLMFGTLTALFTGTSRTVTSPAMRTSAAAAELICWLLLMLAGGAIFGQRAEAQRCAGILLTALASYLVIFFCMSYGYARTLFPQVEGLYHWDATLQWLVILAMTGFALVGLSDGGKSSRSA